MNRPAVRALSATLMCCMVRLNKAVGASQVQARVQGMAIQTNHSETTHSLRSVQPWRRHAFAAAGVVVAASVLAPSNDARAGIGRDPSLRCSGEVFRIVHVDGGNAPYIRLSADRHAGAFLLDYAATHSTLSRVRVGAARDLNVLNVASFSLPGFPTGRFLLTNYPHKLAPRGGQIGVVGTDFLSLLTADFSFRANESDVVLSTAVCDETRLRKRGLVPVAQTGFFSSTPDRRAGTRANIPVVFLRLGSLVTWAQVDTGYDDFAAPLSIDINDALYAGLQSAGVALRRKSDIMVSTCAGLELRRTYAMPDVTIQSETGRPIRRLRDVTLLRKSSTACGGIARRTEPAAQIAASVLRRIGEIVFDPKSERIWLRPDGDTRR